MNSIGVAIAERIYQRVSGGSVVVRVGIPVPFPEGDNFFCPYEIDGVFADRIISRAGGVDAIQALLLALQTIRTTLENSGEGVFWFDEHDPDLGLPGSEEAGARER